MKIGIIGSESNHASDFAAELAEFGAESVIDDDLLPSSDLDGVMIVTRDGNSHKSRAIPFIEARIPLFLDKPLTIDSAEAEEIIAAAKRCKVPIAGGSTFKFAKDFLALAARIKSGGFGEIIAVSLSFPAMIDSSYNGFHYYSHHLIELAATLFGYDMKSVRAFEKSGSLVCLTRYEKLDVTLTFFPPETWEGYVAIWGSKAQELRKCFLPDSYNDGVRAFLDMIETGVEPTTHDELIFPVKVSRAIEKSYKNNNKEVEVL